MARLDLAPIAKRIGEEVAQEDKSPGSIGSDAKAKVVTFAARYLAQLFNERGNYTRSRDTSGLESLLGNIGSGNVVSATSRISPAQQAAAAMDKALVATIVYLKDPEKYSEKEEAVLSELWLTAARAVAQFDPELARAIHFKGVGWIDESYWELAKTQGLEISIEEMQKQRQLLNGNIRGAYVSENGMNWERVAIFAFGVIFVTAILIISLFVPDPTQTQWDTFKTVLALAAAGVAALVPGFINIKYKTFVRAGGAVAVFLMVFFFAPASPGESRFDEGTQLEENSSGN